MRERCTSIAVSLHDHPPVGIPTEEVGATRRFLEWLSANHFTFLGYREYTLDVDDRARYLLAP